jgi:flagellin
MDAAVQIQGGIIMVVQHNVTAMNANRQLGITTGIQAKSSEKLSSGYKINRAADDAAGLAISEKMRRQVRGLTQASTNAQDGISMAQTAEGALNEVHDMLQRMNELANKAATGTLTTNDRSYIQQEVTALKNEIDRTANDTKFNEKDLLGSTATDYKIQVGADNGQYITIKMKSMKASDLSVASLDVGSQAGASAAIANIKTGITTLSSMRADLGAVQNRLEHTVKNLDNVAENTQAAESLIRDTDMAKEMVRYSNNNILAQAGQSMLAQANQSNQGVLSLLG